MNGLAVLKGLVVFMGMLIIGGLVTLGVMIYLKLGSPATQEVQRGTLTLPLGARVVGQSGGGDKVHLLLILPDGSERLMSFDPIRGRPLADLSIERK